MIEGRPDLSIVIPMFNEELVIEKTLTQLDAICQKLPLNIEIVLVDDGSTDRTVAIVESKKLSFANLRLITSSQNQGHMYALSLGMRKADGNYCVTMDSDLQDPPELIIEMHNMFQDKKIDVVQAVRKSRDTDTFFKRNTSRIFYSLISRVIDSRVIPQAADFRMMTREVLDVLNSLPEKQKIYRFLIPALGFNIQLIEFSRSERGGGETKYPLSKMIRLAVDSIFNFSAKPLKIITKLGFLLSSTFFTVSLSLLIFKSYLHAVPGWTSLLFVILATQSLIISVIGIVGEYVALIFQQLQNRPLTKYDDKIISKVWNQFGYVETE
jgi:polyisoprenyl-phosphate glycosyltransferase